MHFIWFINYSVTLLEMYKFVRFLPRIEYLAKFTWLRWLLCRTTLGLFASVADCIGRAGLGGGDGFLLVLVGLL